jgi:hypothetical protein
MFSILKIDAKFSFGRKAAGRGKTTVMGVGKVEGRRHQRIGAALAGVLLLTASPTAIAPMIAAA